METEKLFEICESHAARLNGYQGRNGWDVLSDMLKAIAGEEEKEAFQERLDAFAE